VIGRVSLGREQVRLSKRLLSVELVTGSVRLKGEHMKLSKRLLSVELVLVTGSVRLKGEQMKLSKRLLSVELVTGSVRLKGEQMKLSKGLVMSAKEVMSLVILIKQILIIMPPCAYASPDLCVRCMWQTIKSGQGILDNSCICV